MEQTSRHPEKRRWERNTPVNRFNCGRRLRDQRSENEETVKERKVGQGRVKGEKRQKGKGTKCGAHFTYKLIPCINGHEDGDDGEEDCFNLSVRLKYDHNHEISSTEAWKFLDVSKETKERYFQLFSDAFSPASFGPFEMRQRWCARGDAPEVMCQKWFLMHLWWYLVVFHGFPGVHHFCWNVLGIRKQITLLCLFSSYVDIKKSKCK